MQGTSCLLTKCKENFIHGFFLSTKVSVGAKIFLEPLTYPFPCCRNPIPNRVLQYWVSLHVLDKLEYMLFRVFDILSELNDRSHGSDRSLVLDLIYKYCISGKWTIWLCGFCHITFSNVEDYKFHIINYHFCDINWYIHENLPNWACKSMEKIWGTEGESVGDDWDHLAEVANPRGFLFDIFEIRVESDMFLDWLYGGSSSVEEGMARWEEKVAEVRRSNEKLMNCINQRVDDVKRISNVLFADAKEVNSTSLLFVLCSFGLFSFHVIFIFNVGEEIGEAVDGSISGHQNTYT
jgi:Protein of unknown function (DUF629)